MNPYQAPSACGGVFDISEKNNFSQCNLICDDEVYKINLEKILEKLESIWPTEFKKEKIKKYVENFFIYEKYQINFEVKEEQEYLTFCILNKIYEKNLEIQKGELIIRDNVKSFLEQI